MVLQITRIKQKQNYIKHILKIILLNIIKIIKIYLYKILHCELLYSKSKTTRVNQVILGWGNTHWISNSNLSVIIKQKKLIFKTKRVTFFNFPCKTESEIINNTPFVPSCKGMQKK